MTVKTITKKQKTINIKLAKKVLVLIAFLVVTSLMVKGIDNLVKWARNYTIVSQRLVIIKFQKPLEIVSLVELKQRKEMKEITNQLADKVIADYHNPKTLPKCSTNEESTKINPTEFFDIIWKNESSKGTDTTKGSLHMTCRARNKWNELGFNPKDKFCFSSEKEARLYISYYVEKNCNGLSTNQCLCFYNEGKVSDSCAYSRGDLGSAN